MSKVEIKKPPKAKVLVVDDELIVAMDMKHSLELAGYQVAAIAVSAQDAFSKTEKEKPDIILMDIILKGAIDGIDAAKTLNENYNLPIIFITASSDPQTFERAKLVGHYGYLIKPIEHRDLINTIEIALYKHRLEEKLRRSELNFRSLFNNAPISFQTVDENGNLLNVNIAWEKMLGYREQEVIGLPVMELMTNESKKKFPEIFAKFKQTGLLVNQECDMITKAGEVLSIVADGNIIYDDAGNFLQTQCTLTNVTEQKAARKLIELAEARYKAIIGTSIDGFAVIDTTGKIIEINDSYSKLIGYSKEEMKQKFLNDIEFIESPEETKKRINKIIAQGTDSFETKHISKEGKIIDIEASVIFLKEYGHFLCFFQDITETKQASEITKSTLERLSALVTSIEQGILYENEGRKIEFVNLTFCNYFGIPTPDMLIGFDCDAAAEMSKILFQNSDDFINVINETVTGNKTVLNEELYLVDGRVFERDYIPVKSNGKKTGNYWIYRDITERKNHENEIEKAEELLRFANEASIDGIWDWDVIENKLVWNKRCFEMIGYDNNEFTPNFDIWYDLIHSEDRERAWNSIKEQIKTHIGRFSEEFRFRCKDGSYIWMIGKGKAVQLNEDGSAKRMVGTHTDISKRKKAEIALIESEKKYKTVTENSFDLITVIDSDGKYEYCNQLYYTILGYNPDELIGKDSLILVHPSELGRITSHVEQLLKSGVSQEITLTLVCKDGSQKKIFHRVKLLMDENNKPHKIFIIAQDVTDKLAKEELLLQNSILLNKLSENVPGVIYQFKVTADGKMSFPYSTDAIYEIYEVFPDQIKEDSSIILNVLHPEDIERVMQSIEESRVNLTIWEYNYRVKLPVKGVRWLSGIARPERLDDGGTIWYGFISDITERVKVEDSLNLEAIRNRIFMDTALDGILIINQDHSVVDVNKRYCEMSGYSKAELLKMHTWDFETRMSEEEIRKNFVHLEKISAKFESVHKRKDGSIFDVEVSANGALINDTGFVFTIVRDITESKKATDLLKQSELMLRESQKAARIGYYFFDIANDTWTSSEMLDEIFGITPDYRKTFSSWLEIIYTNDHDIMNSYFSQLLKRRKKQFNKEYRIVSQNNGTVKWVHGLGALEYDDEGNPLKMTGAIQDITDRKEKEEKIIKQNEKLSALLEISKKVSSILDIESILQATTDSIREMITFDNTAIYHHNEDSIYLMATSPPLPKGFPEFLRLAELKNHPHIKKAIYEGKPVIIADSQTAELTEEERIACEKLKLRSILYVPLLTSGGVYGCLNASSSIPYDITEDDVVLCEAIAKLSALALEKAQLYEVSQKNILDLEHGITERLRIEDELKDQLDEINRFNILMVGRENRMIELKNEINELLIKNGLQQKYRTDDN